MYVRLVERQWSVTLLASGFVSTYTVSSAKGYMDQ